MKKWRMLLLALLLALLCGCAASEPLPDYAPEESQRLILYTSHKKEVWQPIVKEFEARTGVWVTVVEGGSNELLEQLAAKTDAPQADVMFGGGVESLESYQDLFAPYTCADADAILPQYRAKDDIWTPFSSLPLVFVYNPKLVGAEEITGWADLLRPSLRERSPLPTRRSPARAIRRSSRCSARFLAKRMKFCRPLPKILMGSSCRAPARS